MTGWARLQQYRTDSSCNRIAGYVVVNRQYVKNKACGRSPEKRSIISTRFRSSRGLWLRMRFAPVDAPNNEHHDEVGYV